MPALDHEALLQLFRNQPGLVAELLRSAQEQELPLGEARPTETDLTQVLPTEYRADLVIALGGVRLVVEVQMSRDPKKRWSWPLYVSALRAKERCPVLLVVVTTRPEVASWARKPIELGNLDSHLVPAVLAPEAVPRVVDFEAARANPELAVLSALAHAEEAGGGDVAFAALVAAAGLDPDRALFYGDLVLRSLGEAARSVLEELMSSGRYEYQSDFARKYYEQGLSAGANEGRTEGRAEGRAEASAHAVLTVLTRRGLPPSDEQRARITSCRDLALLDQWLERSLEVTSVDDLFR
ncbi:hypothetical protein [Vulgatibacter sp.]|uniref:hypothetical protein n=1 Tax=Vulgatibacter sp. TaxID=1971226 RepID=UPI003564FEDD